MLVSLVLSMNYPAVDTATIFIQKGRSGETGKIALWHLGELGSKGVSTGTWQHNLKMGVNLLIFCSVRETILTLLREKNLGRNYVMFSSRCEILKVYEISITLIFLIKLI